MAKNYVMFVDETGSSDANNRPFTVTGVIFEYKCAVQRNNESDCLLKQELDSFKTRCFNTSNVHLHLRDILNGQGEFSRANGITLAQLSNFWTELPGFLSSLDFKIISVTVDKDKLREYYVEPKDPYIVAFAHVMKSLYSFISRSDVKSVRIVLESREENLNLEMQKGFFNILSSGTVHLDISTHKEKIKSFVFAEKRHPNYQSGLEIADMVCLPLSRARMGKLEVSPRHISYGTENKIFSAIRPKIYNPNSSQDFRNWGFKKVPIIKRIRPWSDNTRTP